MTVNLTAGQSYTAKVHVTNVSTQLGQPIAAQLSVSLAAVVGSSTIVSSQQSYLFAASESHDFTFPIAVPSGASGVGVIAALLLDPTGNWLASASLDIQVSSGGAVVFTSAVMQPFAIKTNYLPAWNLTFYEAVIPMTISWNASERIPAEGVEGPEAQVSIGVSWTMTRNGVTYSGSFSTTPGPGLYGPYYFTPGAGSIGWPYAAALWSTETNPPRGVWNYMITCKAFQGQVVGGSRVIGEATFQGTVTVS